MSFRQTQFGKKKLSRKIEAREIVRHAWDLNENRFYGRVG